jgi:hypothetical protein
MPVSQNPDIFNQEQPIKKQENIGVSFETTLKTHSKALVMSGQNPNSPSIVALSNGNGTEPTSLSRDDSSTDYILGGIAIIIIIFIVYLIIKGFWGHSVLI